MKKVKVDPVKCIGCGLCVSIAEKVFKMNEQGKSETIEGYEVRQLADGGVEGKVQEAIDACPVAAILI